MRFEQSPPQESAVEGAPQSPEQETRASWEKVKKIGRMMAAWGMISIAAAEGVRGSPEYTISEPREGTKTEALTSKPTNYFLEMLSSVSKETTEPVEIIPTTKFIAFHELHLEADETVQVFEKSYPKRWIQGDIQKVVFRPQVVVPMPKRYGIESTVAGSMTTSEKGPSEGRLYQSRLPEVVATWSHETCHANDWQNDEVADVFAKRRLFSAVVDQFFSPSAYESAYVREIKNPDFPAQQYLKFKEWWADVCAEYFNNPKGLREFYPREYALVDNWVRSQDPDFDPEGARRARVSVIERHFENLAGVPIAAKQEIEGKKLKERFLQAVSDPKRKNISAFVEFKQILVRYGISEGNAVSYALGYFLKAIKEEDGARSGERKP